MNFEKIRKKYEPDKIKLLLVGESPPASGRFFYLKGPLTTYTSKAFERAFDTTFKDTEAYLNFLKQKQCYLDDLCLNPVDKFPPSKRNQKLKESINPFAERLKKLNPEVIAIVLKKIEKYVTSAIEISRLSCPVYTLPFPGHGHQAKYKEQLYGILKKHY